MVFYEPGKTSHGLPRDPFKVHIALLEPVVYVSFNLTPTQACVVPRPIGWISTRSKRGTDNLAPYSQFNNLTFDPPYVMFSANQDMNQDRKNTVTNAEDTGVFCWNIATYDLREEVNKTAQWFEPDVDEFAQSGLEKTQAELVKCAMVKRSPVQFECEYYTTIRLPGNPPMGTVDVVVGKVIGIHIDPNVLTDGKIDIGKVQPIARCGYYEYAVIRPEAIFEMIIPGDPKQLIGLEGNAKEAKDVTGVPENATLPGTKS